MGILNVYEQPAGLVGVNPPIVYINTNDSLTQVTAPAYLNSYARQAGFNFTSGSMAIVSNTDSQVGFYVINIDGAGVITLAADATPHENSYAGWDENKNLSANNFLAGYQEIATAGGTTTFTVASPFCTRFTGSAVEDGVLPVVSTLALGQPYEIINDSSDVVTVKSSGGNTIQAMVAGTRAVVKCISLTGTDASSWDLTYSYQDGAAIDTIGGNTGTISGETVTLQATRELTGSSVSFSGDNASTMTLALENANQSIFLGPLTGGASATGIENVAVGSQCLQNCTTAGQNVAIGERAGGGVTSSTSCTLVGALAGRDLDSGSNNVLVGRSSGAQMTTAATNVGVGNFALSGASTGNRNTAVGNNVCTGLTSGGDNVIVGYLAGAAYASTESSNIVIGANNSGIVGDNNTLRIGGGNGTGPGQSNRCFISGISTNPLTPSATIKTIVLNTSNTQLGTAESLGTRAAPVNLTSGVAATIATITAATDSANGGQLGYVIRCDDGAEFQAESGIVKYSIVNKATVLTDDVVKDTQSQAVSSGTLSTSFAFSSNALQVTATTSLTATTFTITIVILNNY